MVGVTEAFEVGREELRGETVGETEGATGLKEGVAEGAAVLARREVDGEMVLLTDGTTLAAVVGPLNAQTPLQVVLETLVCGTKVSWMR